MSGSSSGTPLLCGRSQLSADKDGFKVIPAGSAHASLLAAARNVAVSGLYHPRWEAHEDCEDGSNTPHEIGARECYDPDVGAYYGNALLHVDEDENPVHVWYMYDTSKYVEAAKTASDSEVYTKAIARVAQDEDYNSKGDRAGVGYFGSVAAVRKIEKDTATDFYKNAAIGITAGLPNATIRQILKEYMDYMNFASLCLGVEADNPAMQRWVSIGFSETATRVTSAYTGKDIFVLVMRPNE